MKIIVGGLEALRDDIAIWAGYLKVSEPGLLCGEAADLGVIETSR